jgi:hypothetical protein
LHQNGVLTFLVEWMEMGLEYFEFTHKFLSAASI